MSDGPILVTAEGGVRVLTLNRPDQLNATDEQMHTRLAQIWSQLRHDAEARVVVITGAGKAFSAGGDFDFIQAQINDQELRERTFGDARLLLHSLASFPLPVIAAVNGPAVGLGASLAVMCDLVVMGERAFLQDPHLGVGLVVGDGGVAWPLHVGLLRAKHALLLGERISAQRALEWGLANEIADDPLARAMELARLLESRPAAALQASKLALNGYLRAHLDGAFEDALQAEMISMASPEHREIIAGLIERAQ